MRVFFIGPQCILFRQIYKICLLVDTYKILSARCDCRLWNVFWFYYIIIFKNFHTFNWLFMSEELYLHQTIINCVSDNIYVSYYERTNFKRPNYLIVRKHIRSESWQNPFLAIFFYLDNNWAVWAKEKVPLLTIFKAPKRPCSWKLPFYF